MSSSLNFKLCSSFRYKDKSVKRHKILLVLSFKKYLTLCITLISCFFTGFKSNVVLSSMRDLELS